MDVKPSAVALTADDAAVAAEGDQAAVILDPQLSDIASWAYT